MFALRLRSILASGRAAPVASQIVSRPNLAARFQPSFNERFFSSTEAGKDASASPAPAAADANRIEETVNVSRKLVRYIIGPKGATLKALKDRTGGASLVFSKEFTEQDEEIAKISGDETQVAAMKAALAEEVEKAKQLDESKSSTGGALGGKIGGSAAGAGASNYVEEVIVDAFYVGSLIGKQGIILKDMEKASGARITYSDRESNAKERTARIRGTPAQVQAAKKLITEKVHSVAQDSRMNRRTNSFQRGDREQNNGEKRPSRARQPLDSDVKQLVEVPTECVGYLIGKGGRGLFSIQDATQTRLDFAREDHREGAREVTIFGSEEAVQKACEMIQQRVKESLDRNKAPPA